MDEKSLREFVEPYYFRKDAMHGLTHISRVIDEAQSISRNHRVDKEVLTCAAYLHGID